MSEKGSVLVVDDEPNILKTLTIGLEAVGFRVEGFGNPCDALERLEEGKYDIAFIDLMMEPIDGMQVLKEIRRRSPATTAVIIIHQRDFIVAFSVSGSRLFNAAHLYTSRPATVSSSPITLTVMP